MVVVVDLLRKVQSLEPVVFYVSGQGPMAHWNREHSTDQAPKVQYNRLYSCVTVLLK